MNKSARQFSSVFLPGLMGLIFLIPGAAYSQDKNKGADAPLLPPVTVVKQGQRTDTVTIIDRQEIEGKHSAVAYDVLEMQPGLHVVRRLGMTGSGLSRLTIRGNGGVGPAGIQVYVDGRPDATVSFAHPTPSALSLENAERIEVIHGPSPVLYGSGKTGVINIITANPEPGFHKFLEVSYGSFDTTENFARLSYGGKKGYVRLSGSHRSTNGDNDNSDALVRSFNFKGGYQINDIFDVSFTAAQTEDEFDVFGSFFVPGPFTDPRTESINLTQTVYDLTLNANFGNVTSSLKFYQDDLDPTSQILDGSEQGAEVEENGLRFKTTWVASTQTNVIAGIDYLKAEAANSPVLPPFGGPGLSIPRPEVHEKLNEKAIYALVNHSLSQAVSVSGGLRHTDHSEFGNELSGELGVLWSPELGDAGHLLNGTTFRARATRGFQSPTLQQLFGVFRGGQGGPANLNLQPEIVEQFEIGFNKTFPRGNFDVVVYVQEGEDLIELPASPPPPPPNIENDVDYSNHGVEARLHYALRKDLHTMLGVSIADFDQDNNRFLRAPEKTVDVGVTYRRSIKRENDFSVSLYGRYAADAVDVPVTPSGSARVDLDNYFVADLKVNYHVNDNARVFFEVDNITDEDYELVTGIPAPSLSAFAGVSLSY